MARTLSTAISEAIGRAIDEVLYERGLHSATLDDICARAGVSKPALYRHVGGRDEVFALYLHRRRARRIADIEAAIEEADPEPRSRLMALVDWIADSIASEGFVGCGFHRAIQQDGPNEELLATTREFKLWVRARIEAELEGVAQRPTEAATHLFLLLEGALATGAYLDPNETADGLRRAAEAALGTQSGIGT